MSREGGVLMSRPGGGAGTSATGSLDGAIGETDLDHVTATRPHDDESRDLSARISSVNSQYGYWISSPSSVGIAPMATRLGSGSILVLQWW
ncbi:hypothetical protein TIFTF001_016884 [Ficus carica]|uniref:Uncharacterized protein n=1 Tax=Ficus carica TaxID=3494 RepID=A0AA88D6L1_FICCA|nr:hypothetical protein TIFTF001_016884 [Ficus carica]